MNADSYYIPAGPDYEVEDTETRAVEHECDEERFEEGFAGDVEVTVTRFGPAYMQRLDWVCPQCGTAVEDEEDFTDPFEPDDY